MKFTTHEGGSFVVEARGVDVVIQGADPSGRGTCTICMTPTSARSIRNALTRAIVIAEVAATLEAESSEGGDR